MSAILMKCTHCGGKFISGMVGMTPWPQHVCADGTEHAPADFTSLDDKETKGVIQRFKNWKEANREREAKPW